MFKINTTELPDPAGFRVEREDIYAGEYVSQTGKQFADVVGWRYAPITLTWEVLQDAELQAILSAGNAFNVTFIDPEKGEVTTAAKRTRIGATHKRRYWKEQVAWLDFSMEVIFIDAYTD